MAAKVSVGLMKQMNLGHDEQHAEGGGDPARRAGDAISAKFWTAVSANMSPTRRRRS